MSVVRGGRVRGAGDGSCGVSRRVEETDTASVARSTRLFAVLLAVQPPILLALGNRVMFKLDEMGFCLSRSDSVSGIRMKRG